MLTSDLFSVDKADQACSRLINYDNAHKTSVVHAILADRFIKRFKLDGK